MKSAAAFALVFVLALTACSDGPAADDDDDVTPADAGGGAADSDVPLNWVPLITGEWSLQPFSENTSDSHSMTMDRSIYVGAIRPIAPVGTHHTVLGIDGIDFGNIIYASGVGTNAIVFPEGVGLKLDAGENIVLQLHLFNVTGEAISGTSGVEIVEVDAADVTMEADLFLPGPFAFSIPPMQEYTTQGTCTVDGSYSFFALFPHMHQLGTHFKTTLEIDGNDMVLHDDDYSFGDQAFIPFETIAVTAGDKVKTECTWNNTTNGNVMWGESSTTEMCFSILYRFPAGPGEICAN